MNRHSSWHEIVAQYLTHRRRLGYQFRKEEWLLRGFATYSERQNIKGPLTVDLAMQWVCLKPSHGVAYRIRRLTALRGFARYLSMSDPRTEIPPAGLLGSVRRPQPYIYSHEDVIALIAAARRLNPRDGLRPKTYATLIGLLACTGLRISEALHLTRADFDAQKGLLIIRQAKHHSSRLVPLHPSATAALCDYAGHRDHLVPATQAAEFFITDRGSALRYGTVHQGFHKLCSDLPTRQNDQRPRRIHDLRHTFACRRVQQWYEAEGVDVAHAVTALSVYLGHTKVVHTYWYLTGTPELLQSAAARFEPHEFCEDTEVRT